MRYRVPSPGAAGAASLATPVGPTVAQGGSPRRYEITAVRYVPDANITAQATNFRTLQLVNKGQDGLQTMVIATLPLSTAGTNDMVRQQAKVIPQPATPQGNAIVREGDVLQWESNLTGTGLVDPGGEVITTEQVM